MRAISEAFLQLKKTNDAYAAIDKGSFTWDITIMMWEDSDLGRRGQWVVHRVDALELDPSGHARASTVNPPWCFPLGPDMSDGLEVVILKNSEGTWVAAPSLNERMKADSAQTRAGVAAYAFMDGKSGFHTDNFPESPHAFDEIALLELTPDEKVALNKYAVDIHDQPPVEKTLKPLKTTLKKGAREKANDPAHQKKYGGLGILNAFLNQDLYEIGLLGVEINEPPMEATLWIDPETNLVVKQSFDVTSVIETDGEKQELQFAYEIAQTAALLDDQPPAERFVFDPAWKEVEEFISRREAIDFTLKDMDDQEVSLSDLKGSVVILDFWATWCGPCIEAMPHLQELYDKYKEDGLLVYGINQEDPEKPAAFLDQNGYTFPTLKDAAEAFELYKAQTIPATYIIDREGYIVAFVEGFVPGDTRIDEALAVKAGFNGDPIQPAQ